MTDARMSCGLCVAPGRFAIEQRPVPQAAPEGWLLVDIAVAGLCGTDYHIFEGKHPYLEYPRVIGHELSGRVVEGGHGFTAGQLVVINPYIACGTCHACRRGKPNCCMAIGVLGVHRDGGMCGRIAVPAINLIDASGLTPREAAIVEFLAIGAHAVQRSELTSADRVLVTGAGPIGLGAAIFARLRGAEVHLLDTSAQRLDAAGKLGFTHLHAPGTVPADGFDVVMDATGNPRAMEAGFAHVAHGGTYVLISVVKDDLTFNDAEFHKREMRLIGSRNALAADFQTVMDALKSGAVRQEALVSAVLPLSDLPRRIAELAADRGGIIKAVVEIAP
ncbi:zinc-binding alcohol dehydrogenase family protein [Neotabrizicola shimadae]|uniref:Zinc-binding alcohol dehydrogenase family protein n=1 Tax=Neotabrizicola shimadae TaxID=2807096 RepID=A0A8G1ECR5_9RHOB|nr:zinc-binding alcohol dehydrogenase family protein [Neotabrizicola shimadae]QYZ69358.1 zinc-binding alcohol dehydrogenase family protein [Neotabrizicola shimadae]